MSNLVFDPSINYEDHLILYASKNSRRYDGEMNAIVRQYMYSISQPPFTDRVEKYNRRCFDYYCGLIIGDTIVAKQNAVIQRSLEVVPDLGQWIFLTVGFDDKSHIDGHIMLSFARKVCAVNLKKGVPLFTSGLYSLEKHRKDGSGKNYVHHHIHFLLNLGEHCRSSKIVEVIYAIAGIKEFCREKNFIDVKTPNAKDYKKRAQPYAVCDNYVRGIKTSEKAECVGDDILWRMELGLHHHYEYAR